MEDDNDNYRRSVEHQVDLLLGSARNLREALINVAYVSKSKIKRVDKTEYEKNLLSLAQILETYAEKLQED